MHNEYHSVSKIGWLRAAVLGANDGIVSTASLLLGVASANLSHSSIVMTGIAGLVAGAMSMATGEYVSVSSQSDTEKAALRQEQEELNACPQGELQELADIYIQRGLEPELARQVARSLMAEDALKAHARDELGITDTTTARPFQAAVYSAFSFAVGSSLPLLLCFIVSEKYFFPAIIVSTITSLALLGGIAAKAGGAPVVRGVIRITFWSALAMSLSYCTGYIFGIQETFL